MSPKKTANAGLFSALFGFLAIFFQASAPAPTVDFTARGDVFSADRTSDELLALEHQTAGASIERKRSRIPTIKRRRLRPGQYVGEFLDIVA